MNKIVNASLAAVLAMGMTSCFNDANDEVTTAQIYMYNMVERMGTSTDPFTLTQANTSFEFNFGKSLITSEVRTYITDGLMASFKTSPLAMTPTTEGYVFSSSTVPAAGFSVRDFKGKYDPVAGVMAYDYTLNDTYHVYSVSNYLYQYSNTTITEKGVEIVTSDNMPFWFIPDAASGKATLRLGNFSFSEQSTGVTLDYKDIEYKIVGSGFTAHVDKVANAQGYKDNDITNLFITITSHGQQANVVFDMGDRHVVMEGWMFHVDK